MKTTRRLAAILAADVVRYSRLIGADEQGTLDRLRSIRAEVIDPKIIEHRGRIVKTTGDGLLVEFSSVVDALHCAIQWQHGMVERDAASPGDNRIEFRIGVHQGDIVVENDDIFGDGVNVADPASKGYGFEGLLAAEVASHKRKFAPGIVSFGGGFFQRCRHPGTSFGPSPRPACPWQSADRRHRGEVCRRGAPCDLGGHGSARCRQRHALD
jgi:Adenylate and Guanylate cyclase catalytic domain